MARSLIDPEGKRNVKFPNNFSKKKSRILFYAAAALAVAALLSSVLFFVFFPDNLMHSDMAAEVLLSKLLAEEGGLLSRNWFYSTEIRIVYTQLIMTPLFALFSDYGTVKLISLILLDCLLAASFYAAAREFRLTKASLFIAMALLLSPLSTEYLDMVMIGNFYTPQIICTYLVLKFFFADRKERKGVEGLAVRYFLLPPAALILGLSGLRYLASLLLPLFGAVCCLYLFDSEEERGGKQELWEKLLLSAGMTAAGGIGFLINKGYLASVYSFDTSGVHFVPLSEVPGRLLTSLQTVIEFFGYREIDAVTPLGLVNVVKFAFLVFAVYVVCKLTKNRYTILDRKQRLLLYYFYLLFLLNWYLLVFTDVLMQYRYWIPVYAVLLLLIGIYFEKAKEKTALLQPLCGALAALTVLSSLYGELWQDVKYNDCEKRYGYMEFLEENNYTFGYATFWNSSVTEYLSDGKLRVAHLGGKDGVSAPYEWLCRKDYYRRGFHKGKTFLLLAKTEEPAIANGDITIMQDSKKVYEDEYYVIYEGEDMYLFSER